LVDPSLNTLGGLARDSVNGCIFRTWFNSFSREDHSSSETLLTGGAVGSTEGSTKVKMLLFNCGLSMVGEEVPYPSSSSIDWIVVATDFFVNALPNK
jgi:hypothetical protein